MKLPILRIIFIIIVFSIISCKNEVKTQKEEIITPLMNKYLSITVNAKVLEDDKFQLYFSEEITGQYHPEDIVEVNVKGQDQLQNIVFNLPERIYPIKIRLDVGTRKFETPINIEEIIFSTGAKQKSFKGVELLEYFKPNKYLEKQTTGNNFDRKHIDGVYDPFFISINVGSIVDNIFSEKSDENH